jgi:CBS domain-containing protein
LCCAPQKHECWFYSYSCCTPLREKTQDFGACVDKVFAASERVRGRSSPFEISSGIQQMKFTASDVMNENVVTFQAGISVREAFVIIKNENFSGAPVVNDDNVLIGVITEMDLLASITLEGRARSQFDQEIPYTEDAMAISADMTVEEIRRFFVELGFKQFPVIDENRRVVGVVSRRDLVRLIAEHMPSEV